MIEILEQHFPSGVAQLVMKFHSHPIADMMHEAIGEWHYYRNQSSISKLLSFHQYMTNKWTLPQALYEQRYLGNDIDDNFRDEHLGYVPYRSHPPDCACVVHTRWPHLRRPGGLDI
jgi:hypothetical protein